MKIRNPIRSTRIVETRTTYIPHILIIGLLWVGAMTWDYHDQAETAKELAAHYNEEHSKCLKGEWRTTTPDGTEWGCMPVMSNIPLKREK